MKVIRKMEMLANVELGGFKVGDQIHVGKHYTATCQKVGKNGAIFMFDQCMDEVMAMNHQKTNGGGYESSDLRKFLQWLSMTSIFNDIREMMVPFKKTGDLLRIPTAEEMFGPEKAHEHYEILSIKNQWPLMKDRYNRIAFRGEDQDKECWWLQNKYDDSTACFAITNSCGSLDGNYASATIGVRVVFRLLV